MHGLWVIEVVRKALAHTLRVPFNATRREIRIDGAIAAGCGFVMLLLSSVIPVALASADARGEWVPRIVRLSALVVLLTGWGFFVIGGYRAITGKHPDRESYTYKASLTRIVIGVAIVVVAFCSLLGLVFLVLYVLGVK